MPDDTWGEAVKAVVVARPGATIDTEELVALVKEKKGSHHAPKSVDVVDAIPMTAVGKPDKVALRARYWAGAEPDGQLMELDGRTALVTGAASGLGAATARRLHERGMCIAVFDRDAAGAAAVADELGSRAVAVPGDVTNDDDVQSAVEAATSLGPLAVVANIAGGARASQRLVGRDGTPHDRAAFEFTMAINTLGTFNVSRFAAAAMAANEPDDDGQRGVIVNTSSVGGLEGQAGQLAYAAAKAAIAGMTLPMARDLAPIGVRVCTIAPGTMDTPLFQAAPDSLKERLVGDIIFPKRMGHPEEFAALVETIVTNSYLNGEVIRLDAALRFPPK